MKNKELLLEISYKCNQRCIHCSSVGVDCSNKLSLDDIETILRNQLPLTRHASMDEIKTVRISGGEPPLISNLIDYVRFFKDNDINVILQTNGTTCIKSDVLSLVDEVWISLYGQNSIHDFVTMGENCSKAVMSIAKIRQTNKIVIQSPVFCRSQMISLYSMINSLKLPLRLFALLNHGKCNVALPVEEQILLANFMKCIYDNTEVTCSLDTDRCNYDNKLVLKPDGTLLKCASHKHNKKLCKK